MITQDDIEKFYKDFASMKLKKPNAIMKQASGLSSGNVSDYLNRKKEPSETFIKAFYEKVYKSSINVPHETKDNTVKEPDLAYLPRSESLAIQALMDIAASNKLLAIAHDKQADANREQAQANRELSEANKKLAENISKLTAGVGIENLAAFDTKFDVLLELLSEVSRGKRFDGDGELSARYAQIWDNVQLKKKQKSTRTGKGIAGKGE